MIRTVVGCIAILVSVLWLPLWCQLILFGVGVVILRYRLALLVPAIVSDVVYAPVHTVTLGHFKMTLVVGALILAWYIISSQTRLLDVASQK